MPKIEPIEQIEYTLENAKKEYREGNYPLSKTISEQLWEASDKNDPYLLFCYGQSLRKVNESNKFIEICKLYYNNKRLISNNYIISTLCWCLYECRIKDYTVEKVDTFNEFIKNAEYIKDNCKQEDANEYYKNPFVLTIIKVVKVYNLRATKNYKEIIKWLSYLSAEKLSEEVFKFTDDNGKDRELASPKEFYYQHMAKALEKNVEYEDCIDICERALREIKKFHYNNQIWINARLHYCKCMIDDNIEEAIIKYKELAEKNNYWYMYHKLSQVCFRFNKIDDALLYACKAFNCKFEKEKMVNLMFDLALLWQAKGNNINAIKFFQATNYYRNLHKWSITEELRYYIKEFEINVDEKPNLKELQNITIEYVYLIEGYKKKSIGTVIKILEHGHSGFIKPAYNKESNIYFNFRDIIDKKTLNIGNEVEYEISKDKRDRLIAVKIKIRS